MSAQPKPEKRGRKPPKRIARAARPRKVSKRPAAVARRKADKEWAAQVKVGRVCGRCLIKWASDAHHVFGKKAHPRLRFDLQNGIGLCRRCHAWAHKHTHEFRVWFQTQRRECWNHLQEQLRRAA